MLMMAFADVAIDTCIHVAIARTGPPEAALKARQNRPPATVDPSQP
jgi:hypothetical protein